MRFKYFISQEHHKRHMSFVKSIFGGEDVCEYGRPNSLVFSDRIAAHDGEDVVWFFSHICPPIHPHLKGKQIFVNHGVSFKNWLDERGTAMINDHLSFVFGGAYMHERTLLRGGVKPAKIRQISYPILFEIPKIPVRENAVLFSSTVYTHWNHYQNLYEILKHLHPSIDGYLTMHPNTRDAMRDLLLSACRGKDNIKILETQEELLKAYAYCSCVVGGSSSVCAPFWFLKKPVIFLKGGEGYNLFKRFGWSEIKKDITDPDFHRVLDESTKISHWAQFSPGLVKNAKVSAAAQDLFYPSSRDREWTINRIKECVSELSEKNK